MRRLPLPYVVLAAVLGLVYPLLVPDCASACSCAEGAGSEQEIATKELERSEAVFVGEVMEVSGPRQQKRGVFSSADPVTVTFRVSEVWKGPEKETLEVTTKSSDASCGYPFREGESYLVYAPEGLEINLCSGTTRFADAGGQIEALGPGETPTEGQEESTTAGTDLPESSGLFASLSGSVLIALAGAGVLTASVLLLRKRRHT